MEYKKLVSVTGLPGLFELLSSKSDGAVVRSLEDNTTKFVSSRQHNFSHLESIEIYTSKENTTLAEIFTAMKESKEKAPDTADGKTLKAYFEKVYPEIDFERVYASDMKKMVKWFGIINKNKIDITEKTAEEKEASSEVKHNKPAHSENQSVKNPKPQQVNPRKIESRGVK
jgi:hypothetical protein